MYAAGASQEHMAGVIQEHVDCSHNVATRTPAKTGMEKEHQKSIAIKASPYESAPPESLLAVKSELITNYHRNVQVDEQIRP